MQLRQTIISIVLFLQAHKGLGAAIGNPDSDISQIEVATAADSYSACNCPNNCKHEEGATCRYYTGVSKHSKLVNGVCLIRGSDLVCVVSQ
ncbi:hypothetical protein GGR57DRAFT_502342 [Xylariaceae sp. FL1272]|nr:hypothetical protein GGR57DRAFT_502342 [Xylariaceae sp. FL1272]